MSVWLDNQILVCCDAWEKITKSIMQYLTLHQGQDQPIQKAGHCNSHQVTENFSPSKPTEVSSNQYSEGKTPYLTKLCPSYQWMFWDHVYYWILQELFALPLQLVWGQLKVWQGIYPWLLCTCLLAGLQHSHFAYYSDSFSLPNTPQFW